MISTVLFVCDRMSLCMFVCHLKFILDVCMHVANVTPCRRSHPLTTCSLLGTRVKFGRPIWGASKTMEHWSKTVEMQSPRKLNVATQSRWKAPEIFWNADWHSVWGPTIFALEVSLFEFISQSSVLLSLSLLIFYETQSKNYFSQVYSYGSFFWID